MSEINLLKFILTVFVISWIGVVPALLIANGYEIPEALKSFELLMTLGPILGACIFIYRAQGTAGLKSFFKRLLITKTSLAVVLVALVSPLIISFLASFIGFTISDSVWPASFAIPSIATNGLMIFVMYLIFNTEELAWRGVVFDKLYNKHGYIKACLIIIPIWWLFHMPLFLFPGGHQAGYGLLEFTIIVIAQSFLLGWIYVKSSRSLLYVHMHHQLINGMGQAFPIFPIFIGGNMLPFWVFCGLMMILAVVVVSNSKKGRL